MKTKWSPRLKPVAKKMRHLSKSGSVIPQTLKYFLVLSVALHAVLLFIGKQLHPSSSGSSVHSSLSTQPVPSRTVSDMRPIGPRPVFKGEEKLMVAKSSNISKPVVRRIPGPNVSRSQIAGLRTKPATFKVMSKVSMKKKMHSSRRVRFHR